jgi:hypothetical protein
MQAALAEAEKALAEKTTLLTSAESQHAAAAKAAAESVAGREQAEKALAEVNTRITDSAKDVESIAAILARFKEATSTDSTADQAIVAQAEAALEKVRQDRQAYLDILLRDATAAVESRTKVQTETSAQVEAVAKQVEEAKKAADEAAKTKTGAESNVARASESIERSARAVEQAKQEQTVYEGVLANEEQHRAAAAHGAEQSPVIFAHAAFSADGRQLALAAERRLFLYDADAFVPQGTLETSSAPIADIYYVADDKLATLTAAAGQLATLTSWETRPSWRLERSIGTPDGASPLVDRVLALDFSPDGKLLATGSGQPSRSGQVALWNVADGALVRMLSEPHSDAVFGLEFSPDGTYLASASADRMMKVFRVADGSLVRTFEGHTDHVIDVTWRANGKQLATCGADNKIKVWDFATGEQRRTIEGAGKEVTAITYVGTSSKLVSSSGDRQVRIHNADDGAVVQTLSGAANYLFSCAADETGGVVVAGGADRVLRVWNTADGKERFSFAAEASNK